jgi:hypothetical protein
MLLFSALGHCGIGQWMNPQRLNAGTDGGIEWNGCCQHAFPVKLSWRRVRRLGKLQF